MTIRLALAPVLFLVAAQGVAFAQHETYETRDEWYLRPAEGCTLYVTEFGVGDTVVVVHGGFGAEHSYLLDAFDGLEDEYHLVFYDQRGSLRSPCPDSLVSIDAHLEDLDHLRRALELERMDLFAHSMGTFLAMSYLERHPERVENLVLSAAVFPKMPSSEEETAAYAEQQAAAKAFMERPAVQAEVEEEGLDRPADSLSPREATHRWRITFAGVNIYHVDRWRELRGGQVFYDQSAGTAAGSTLPDTANFLDDMAAHDHPVTMIMGDHDFADIGLETYRPWLEPIDNVELIELENAGHAAWIDRPEAFREALRRGLSRTD